MAVGPCATWFRWDPTSRSQGEAPSGHRTMLLVSVVYVVNSIIVDVSHGYVNSRVRTTIPNARSEEGNGACHGGPRRHRPAR